METFPVPAPAGNPGILYKLADGTEATHELTRNTTSIGRHPDSSIPLDYNSVSIHHAELFCRNGRYFVRDLKSKNGTCVNGHEIEEAELNDGDLIYIGEFECTFRSHCPTTTHSRNDLSSGPANEGHSAASPEEPGKKALDDTWQSGDWEVIAPGGIVSKSKSGRLAKASLILGCLGFLTFALTSIPALICGIIAFVRSNQTPDKRGRKQAAAGIILGACSLLLVPVIALFASVAIPSIASARAKAQEVQALSEIKQVGMAMWTYEQDTGHFPDSLDVLVKEKFLNDEKILYKPGTREPKWILTPGVTPASGTDTILLQSAEGYPPGRHHGKAVLTTGDHASWQKD